MAKTVMFLCAGVLLSSACGGTRPDVVSALEKRVQTLETSQSALQKQSDNLALKARISSGLLHGSPLEDFFASPEFWENTYDSGQADCANRCIKANQEHRAACARLTDPAARQKCYEEALQRVTACQRGCAGL
jgi:hypothetical protein